MAASAHCFQRSIPENPKNPSLPFKDFGWPLVLCGPIGDYSYPEHLGPLSINFCFNGVLAATREGTEYHSDTTSFCVVNRNRPTIIRTLTSRRASQIAFFYPGHFIARFLSETSVEVQSGIDADESLFFSGGNNRALLALPDGTLPLFGELEMFVRGCTERLLQGDPTDAEIEEIHAELLLLLGRRYRLHPSWFMEIDHDTDISREVRQRLEMSVAHIAIDPISPMSLEARAHEVGLPKFRYLRLFKRHFGVTPGQFTLLQKMALARWMLKTKAYSVEEISGLLGYRSWSNFALIFRKHVGITPKEYQILPFTRAERKKARQSLHGRSCLIPERN